jgi:HPt (histidine-containing phosphotransfer) domain-containing protein
MVDLKNIQNFDKKFQKEIINIFIETSEETLAKCFSAYYSDNFYELKQAVHKLLSSSASIGALELWKYLRNMEKQLNQNALPSKTDIEMTKRYWIEAVKFLEDYKTKL